MKQRFGDVSGQNLTYTLLAKNAEFDDKLVHGVSCRARTWKEFMPANGKETLLVADLLDSLGEFGIPVLQVRNVRSMKNSDAEGAFKITAVAIILTDFRASPLNIGSMRPTRWCGMNLTPQGPTSRLRRWLATIGVTLVGSAICSQEPLESRNYRFGCSLDRSIRDSGRRLFSF
jgi:hypothetical protein